MSTAATGSPSYVAASTDGRVHWVVIGFPMNVRDLLRSGPDEHSPLNGQQLAGAKLASIVYMYRLVQPLPPLALLRLIHRCQMGRSGKYNFGCAEASPEWDRNYLGESLDCQGAAKEAVERMPRNVKQVTSPRDGGRCLQELVIL